MITPRIYLRSMTCLNSFLHKLLGCAAIRSQAVVSLHWHVVFDDDVDLMAWLLDWTYPERGRYVWILLYGVWGVYILIVGLGHAVNDTCVDWWRLQSCCCTFVVGVV